MNQPATYTETELVAALQTRDEKAFGYLYDHYSAALLGVVSGIIADNQTAGDVLQDVFINIWRKIESYDASKGRLFTWMLNIARNAAIDKLRSKGFKDSQKNQPLSENVDNTIGTSIHPSIPDAGLRKMISQLKDEQRVLIDLSYFQGFTHEEIARAMGIPLGTVKTRIRSALLQLRNMIR